MENGIEKEYQGDFKNGKMHEGKLIYQNGNIYEGNFLNGKMNGQGKMIYVDGREYTGEFKDNKMHGKMILKSPSGKKESVEFDNGELIISGQKQQNDNMFSQNTIDNISKLDKNSKTLQK